MIEIRYGNQHTMADLAGMTVGEAREELRAEFGIPDKAVATLNGGKVKRHAEMSTELNDEDTLSFAVARSRMPFLVGAMLLALALTGGVFAFGFTNGSATLGSAAATNDFALITVNSTTPVTWNPYGSFKGSITTSVNGTAIFNVDTATSSYSGDLAVTVSLTNADTLVKCYRVLAFKLAMYDQTNTLLDINGDSVANSNDYVLLTMDNGAVTMYPNGSVGVKTVRVMSGYYISNLFKAANWATPSAYQPLLFCEVHQR